MIQRLIDLFIILAILVVATSPYTFGYYSCTGAAGTAVFLGLAGFILSMLELNTHDAWKPVALIVVGATIAASPWAFGNYEFMSQAATNTIAAAGGVVVVASILIIIVSMGLERMESQKKLHA